MQIRSIFFLSWSKNIYVKLRPLFFRYQNRNKLSEDLLKYYDILGSDWSGVVQAAGNKGREPGCGTSHQTQGRLRCYNTL